jgi:hypothetical protein
MPLKCATRFHTERRRQDDSIAFPPGMGTLLGRWPVDRRRSKPAIHTDGMDRWHEHGLQFHMVICIAQTVFPATTLRRYPCMEARLRSRADPGRGRMVAMAGACWWHSHKRAAMATGSGRDTGRFWRATVRWLYIRPSLRPPRRYASRHQWLIIFALEHCPGRSPRPKSLLLIALTGICHTAQLALRWCRRTRASSFSRYYLGVKSMCFTNTMFPFSFLTML